MACRGPVPTVRYMMKMETLVATVDQKDRELPLTMNIQTDALIGNQGDCFSIEHCVMNGNNVTYLNTCERGVGKNRNLLLDHATADICILADDDMCFVDGYPATAEKAFRECPKGDVLIFNLIEKNPRRYANKKIQRIHSYNYARYGAARIAFRREAIERAGIRFDLRFGGGTQYGAGEDTVFLKQCLERGLRIYGVPYALAKINQEAPSTWFTGYNQKFFEDKGAVYARLYPVLWSIIAVRFALCKRKRFCGTVSTAQALRYMLRGGRKFQKTDGENE